MGGTISTRPGGVVYLKSDFLSHEKDMTQYFWGEVWNSGTSYFIGKELVAIPGVGQYDLYPWFTPLASMPATQVVQKVDARQIKHGDLIEATYVDSRGGRHKFGATAYNDPEQGIMLGYTVLRGKDGLYSFANHNFAEFTLLKFI